MLKIKRKITEILAQRLAEKTSLIQILIGPRQVGKTTALKTALANRGIYETADSPIPLNAEIVSKWWQEALRLPEKILAIDEVQKISGWPEVVKYHWDLKPLKLILTGSSVPLVEKGLKETLAGRFELLRAEHWNFSEACSAFNMALQQYIEFGCYPGSMQFLSDLNRWSDYVRDSIIEPALGRDLLQLHPVDQPALLRQLFGVAISLPAQVISLQKIQGQLQGKGSIPTISQYLGLLGEAFLVSGIEKYTKSMFRAKKSSPKLIVHDNALLRAFEKPISAKLSGERVGRYFENLVGARFIEAGWNAFYWKDRDFEVDFVVVGPRSEHYAVEVKTTKTSVAELQGLKYFCQKNKNFEPCLVSLVDQKIDGVKSIPPEELLSMSRY